jgi:hypothetical protein
MMGAYRVEWVEEFISRSPSPVSSRLSRRAPGEDGIVSRARIVLATVVFRVSARLSRRIFCFDMLLPLRVSQ